MLILSMIGKFLLGNWKWILLSLGVVAFYWKVNSEWSDYSEWKELQAQTITELTVARDRAVVEAASAQSALWEMKANTARLELLLQDALTRQDDVRADATAQRKVFEEHNFEALTKAKPGLIEKLANKATQERMDAFENAFNQ